tara:strand:+ start:1169 stop:1795 length:627 start_codon:yes stop_codon:yes gene_type:complete
MKFNIELFEKAPIIGILRNINEETVKNLLPVYFKSGFNSVEITMNSTKAVEIIKSSVKEFPEMNIGAGTVCTMEELDLACDAGASFIVSPILSIEIIKKSIERKVAVFPGALTPSEIFKAHSLGATAVKVFPITSFGPKYVKDLMAPLENMKLIPVGGVSKNNIREFFENGSYGVGMASSLFSKNLISKNSKRELSQHFKSILNEIQD